VRRPGARGISGVAVSNGREVTLTDSKGRWSLPIEGDWTTFFVIKPRGWRTRLSPQNLPLGYYHHQPQGSPKQQYRGVAPTGPLPESIDFGLVPQKEGDKFTALFCGDPQPRDLREVGYLAQTVVPELRGTEAAFGVSLGDIAFNNLSTFEPLNEAMGLIGIPWHNVIGNHDLNFDAPDNQHANESFRRVYGPPYYSFDYGPVHFILLRNVEWLGRSADKGKGGASYRGCLGERQLEFIANDLRQVPQNRLVVLMMHIPLRHGTEFNPRGETADRHELYRLIEDRPYTLSFSAHTHHHAHLFMGAEEGWGGAQPHHHIITGTLCGSWFRGAPDERGVPHGTMADGTPRGHLALQFDGHRYSMDGYRVFGRPSNYQMHIELPAAIPQAQVEATPVAVNVFNGSSRSTVKMRCSQGDIWRVLPKVLEPDPRFVRLAERDSGLESPYFQLPAPMPRCPHLWKGTLPQGLGPGTHLVEVVATDMFGNTHHGCQSVRIVA